MEHNQSDRNYSFKDFLPLIIIFLLIAALTIGHQVVYGWNFNAGMRICMASFFLIFGFFKVINLAGFARAYSMYDVIAKRFFWYGYVYPFIELGLGIAYLFSWNLLVTNTLTLLVMLISAAGVFHELRKGSEITCACLGDVFKLPMTYVTLAEDVLMAIMALIMLLSGLK